jgi:hypothetical protein
MALAYNLDGSPRASSSPALSELEALNGIRG